MSRNNDYNIVRNDGDDIYEHCNNNTESLANKSSGNYLISLRQST